MSDVLELDPITRPEPVAAPQWRNLWHSMVGWGSGPCRRCGGDHSIEGTDHWWGCRIHDTKADAETDAKRQLEERKREPFTAFVTWLGAYPVDGAAP